MAINLFNTSGILDRGNEAFKQGYDQMGAMRTDRTNMQAGRAYAGGDRQGAARMLAQGGNIDGARVIQNDIQSDEQQAYTRNRQGLADKRQATMDEQAASKAAAEQRLNILEGVGNKLRGLPLESRKAKLMEAIPLFKWSGYPQEAIDQLAQMPPEGLTDEAIEMTTGKARAEFVKYFNVSGVGVIGVRDDGSKKLLQPAPLIAAAGSNVYMPTEVPDDDPDLVGGPAGDMLGAPSAPTGAASDAMFGSAGQNTIAGGSSGDAIPGYRLVQSARQPQGRAPKARWVDLPGGGQVNPETNEKKNVPGGPDQNQFASLRKEFNSLDEVSKFKDTAASYNQIRVLTASPKPTSTDDIALIFSFMKMLDPGSVVREGEFALIGQSAGVPDRVLMEIARAKVGKGLTPGIREKLVNTSANILLKRRAAYDAQARTYRTIAADIGAKPDLLAEDPTLWRGRIKGGAGAGGAGAKVQTFNTSAGAVTVRAK
jgi:hypothetical protein